MGNRKALLRFEAARSSFLTVLRSFSCRHFEKLILSKELLRKFFDHDFSSCRGNGSNGLTCL